MGERRVRPPKDKDSIVVMLTKGDDGGDTTGVFQTRAHLLTFAAVYGFAKGSRQTLDHPDEGIRQEIFQRHGFDTIIHLLAFISTQDPKILAPTDQADDLRVSIFEEYANGGLERLRTELQGVDDPLGHLLLMVQNQQKKDADKDDFDLTHFLQD